ncbi:ROK family protein [Methylocystis rosea]|uniref:ROK family protein n=1 Tax=Methylocystis rosea TaxID=173366 RepID=A0A3G8M2M7_9HYPH|nr:ROK family protein [Methylocystis rosea]AZG75270.1 ROK family protein [Methylocystis rosea]
MYVVVDIGGTKTRVAGSSDLAGLTEAVILKTPSDYRDAPELLRAAALKAAAGDRIFAVVIGVAGVLSRDKRILVNAPNLPIWNGATLAADVEASLGAPVLLENDTALVGLGEATAGAGQGSAILAYVTISTGVNGARIVDGRIDRATYGFEIGEQYIDAGALNFEELVSGRAVANRFGAEPCALGKDHPIWDELAKITARALHNAIAHWSPDRIVMGGSMMREIGISIEQTATYLRALPRKNPALPDIVHATLGDYGGLWGALARLRQGGKGASCCAKGNSGG